MSQHMKCVNAVYKVGNSYSSYSHNLLTQTFWNIVMYVCIFSGFIALRLFHPSVINLLFHPLQTEIGFQLTVPGQIVV